MNRKTVLGIMLTVLSSMLALVSISGVLTGTAFLERTTRTIIVEDTSEWQLSYSLLPFF